MSSRYKLDPLPPLDPDRDISQNHYWNYHGLDQLLRCKQPITASQDEDLFIAVHQICELAFHQIILDLNRVLDALNRAFSDSSDPIVGDTSEANYFFERVLRLYEVAVTTMPTLMTMRGFAEFRSSIGPTSGFQSFQFRHLEIMSGVARYWDGGTNNAQGEPHIAETEFNRRYGSEISAWFERYASHNLAFYYRQLLERAKAEKDPLSWLWKHRFAAPILKQMQSYEKLQTRFHKAHLGLAAQQLQIVGATIGTGGTAFKEYLAKYERTESPLFPGLE